MAFSGEAAQRDTLELPAGATPATVPKGEDVAIPMMYEKSLEAVRRALALHDPAVSRIQPYATTCIGVSEENLWRRHSPIYHWAF